MGHASPTTTVRYVDIGHNFAAMRSMHLAA
jgi:hypothetical protein